MVLLRLSSPPPGAVDRDMIEGNKYAARSGRSWWGVRYTDGRVVHEWEPNPFSPNGHQDWILLPKVGLQSLRLYCPNRKCTQLGDSRDATGRLFQFKRAVRYVSMGGSIQGGETLAHVVGIIDGLDGSALCYRWEPIPSPQMPDLARLEGSPPGTIADAVAAYEHERREWLKRGCGVGPIEWRDNVFDMKYDNVGALSAENLSLVAGEGR